MGSEKREHPAKGYRFAVEDGALGAALPPLLGEEDQHGFFKCFDYSADGSLIAAGASYNHVELFGRDGKPVVQDEWTKHNSFVSSVKFAPDQVHVARLLPAAHGACGASCGCRFATALWRVALSNT